jgi:hypothetical protein
MDLDFIAQFVVVARPSEQSHPTRVWFVVRKLALPGMAGNNFRRVVPPSPDTQIERIACWMRTNARNASLGRAYNPFAVLLAFYQATLYLNTEINRAP